MSNMSEQEPPAGTDAHQAGRPRPSLHLHDLDGRDDDAAPAIAEPNHRCRSESISDPSSVQNAQQQHPSTLDSPPISISSTEELPSTSSPSSPDNEAPLSSMSDSSSQPSISPPLPISQSTNYPTQAPHLRQTAPKLARVSSDPVTSASTSAAAAPLLFQQQPAPLPTGNRPGGAALPSHMHHHQPSNMIPHQSNHQPQAGPSTSTSRSTRYANPDSHWLSEDEGETFIDDLRNNRQSPRRRGGPRLHSHYPASSFDGSHDQDDDNHDGKNSASTADGGVGTDKRRIRQSSARQQEFFVDSSATAPPPSVAVASPLQPAELQQEVHHPDAPLRSATKPKTEPSAQAKRDIEAHATYRDYAPFIKDLAAITPNLLKALTCPSCSKLMSDPTTLACGHSECLLCVAPKAASVLLRKTSPTSAPIAITAAVLTTEEGNRFGSVDGPPSPPPVLAGSAESPTIPIPKSPRAALADGVCPVPMCKKVTKATSNGRQGLRVDVVLQKISLLLKNRLAALEADTSPMHPMHAPVPQRRSSPTALLDSLDVEDEDEEGCTSEPLYRSSASPGPRLLRSRSHLRTSPPALPSSMNPSSASTANRDHGPSNTSSPDEETKSEDNAKRGMKSKTHARGGRSIKKSRAGSKTATSTWALQNKHYAGLPMLVADVLSELECHICVTLFHEPLTTPCGHTFCKKCLFRSLDHSNRCPLCRSELPRMSFFISSPLNLTLSNMLITTFPILYEQRMQLSKQEESESGLDTPIFVCMVSFPYMPTNLHIYEPKYRLMMRRALDSNKRFGMVLPSRQAGSGGYAQYGTMLEIRNMHTFEDGRSMVETVGVSRFKILESGTMDGYTVGKIERIEDIGDDEEAELERMALERSNVRTRNERNAASGNTSPPVTNEKATSPPAQASSSPITRPTSGLRSFSFPRGRSNSAASGGNRNSASPSSPSASAQSVDPAAATPTGNPNDASASDSMELTNAQLVDVCKGFVEALRTGSTPWLLQRLNSSLPPMPEDPREFTWWMAMLMPIDDHEKARLLQVGSRSLRTCSMR